MTSSSRADLRQGLTLFGAGVLVFGLAAASIEAPGFMDAEYYFSTGAALASGAGFTEPFVWNFLADPTGIPAPSHAYWMPLASLIAAAPMAVFGIGFRVAQLPFVLLAACIPVLTARSAISLGAGRGVVWLAGVLALLPGFFAPYLVTTDTFAAYAVIGGAALWLIGEGVSHPSPRRWALIGLLIGLGHLTRADGLLLWLPAAVGLVLVRRARATLLLATLLGYGAVTILWWMRNLGDFGSILPPGTGRALWLLDYDDLFSYPASVLEPARLLAAGWAQIVEVRLEAVWLNAQTLAVVSGSVVLLPLAIFGGWLRRRHPLVRIAAVYGVGLFLVMSLMFPFAGARGGFFHSSSAWMPLIWALTAIAIHETGRLASRVRWEESGTRRLFAVVAIVVAATLSAWALAGKSGILGASGSFARNQVVYSEARRRMGLDASKTVAVVNPPGFYAATGIQAVALPDGDTPSLREVVDRFEVRWIILEADHPVDLSDLYEDPAGESWLGSPVVFDDPSGKKVVLFPVLRAGGE